MIFLKHLLANWHSMLCQEFAKIVPMYPIMTLGKPKRCQMPFANPVQYRYLAYSAMLSNGTGGNIFWILLF